MKEERDILRDVIGTAPPEEESKTRKYGRIVLALIFMSFFALLIVMAALRRYGT
jgi:hypothetical protein